MSTATVSFDAADYGGGDFDPRRAKVYATNSTAQGITDALGNLLYLGSAPGEFGSDGSGTITVPVPGDGMIPESWQTTFHFDVPDRNAPGGRYRTSRGPFTITEDTTLGELVEEMPVQPEYASQFLNRYKTNDHGNVSGTLTIDPAYGYHVFDATGPTLVTVLPGDDVAFKAISGAADVTIDGSPDLELTDGGWVTGVYYRSAWDFTAGGTGSSAPADETPPSAPSALDATGGSGEVTFAFTPGTDPDSSVTHRYEVYLTADGTAGTSTLVDTNPKTVTGLAAGAYTVRVFARNAAGLNSTVVTDTFTVTAPAGWSLFDTLGPTQIGADGTRSVTTDFTTAGGRTYRVGSGSASPITVVGGKFKVPTGESGAYFVADGPTGPTAREFDYSALAFNSGEFAKVNFAVSQAFGDAGAQLEVAYTTGFEYRARITSSFSSATMVCTAGPGYTLASDGKSVVGIPQSGHARVEPVGQLLHLYIDDDLILTADFTSAIDSGSSSPNPLTGVGAGAALFNGIEIGNLTWETYS